MVALLSGRNFETREFEEAIAEETLARLEKAILGYINETNFKRFIMILKSAGFVDASMIRSQNSVNFAYVLYLMLREHAGSAQVETLVRRWFVMSVLTGRYTGSPETAFDKSMPARSNKAKQLHACATSRRKIFSARFLGSGPATANGQVGGQHQQ